MSSKKANIMHLLEPVTAKITEQSVLLNIWFKKYLKINKQVEKKCNSFRFFCGTVKLIFLLGKKFYGEKMPKLRKIMATPSLFYYVYATWTAREFA
jgi:hypothetical protein